MYPTPDLVKYKKLPLARFHRLLKRGVNMEKGEKSKKRVLRESLESCKFPVELCGLIADKQKM